MLFSDQDLAAFLQDRFEPVWESVRDVPRVTIDFGAGNVVRRTLHGNVATYVCDSEGRVLDIVAGMYEPEAYRARLVEAHALATTARGWGEWHDAARAAYHRGRLAALAGPRQRGADAAKTIAIEGPIENLVRRPVARVSADRAKTAVIERPVEETVTRARPRPALLERVPWDTLRRDTRHNETVRRPQVHEILSAPGRLTPQGLMHRIYRDVLGTDLADPYLGLLGVLTETYPFER